MIGVILGISLTAGFTAAAKPKGPKIVGESGRLYYSIAVEGYVECEDAWVNVPDKVIECDHEAPDAEPERSKIVEAE
jgi:hypothetical protein